MKSSGCSIRRQFGQTLLAFVLVMIIGSSYLLVRAFNTTTPKLSASERTAYQLKIAKQALIGYAASYPDHDLNAEVDGPGYLPCPDVFDSNTDGEIDGVADTNCSGSSNAILGYLPWKTLELPEPLDESGNLLWYALSENFRYGANKQIPLNSETPGQLTVDSTEDIVAIIFAPGNPIAGQNNRPTIYDASQYLDDENNDPTDDPNFVSTVSGNKQFDGVYDSNGDLIFNDRLIYITRAELMQAVEKRVLGEFNQILSGYFTTYGAYPWLSSYANPKIETKQLTGSHTGSDISGILTDASTNFNQWGVNIGDTVWNISDGSTGVVSAVTDTTLSLSPGLRGGANDYFNEGDEYFVELSSFPDVFIGTATTTAGNGLVLADTSAGRDFEALKISVGDILHNVTDGSVGVINAVTDTTLEVDSLSGGTNNAFSAFDAYRISTGQGQATATGGLTLTDSYVEFTSMGIQAGDVVINVTDNAIGSIREITSATQLEVMDLFAGDSNTFSNNDYYVMPRYYEKQGERKGLLAFQKIGDIFPSGFTLDWRFASSAATNTVTGNSGSYNSALRNRVQSSLNNYGSITFADKEAVCRWLSEDIADCYGFISNSNFLTSVATTTGTTNPFTDESTLNDANINFPNTGVKIGDLVYNYDDTSLVITGTAEAGSSGNVLIDTVDFIAAGVEPRTFLVTNTTDNTRGIVQSVTTNTISVISLPGNVVDFSDSDAYTIMQVKTGIVNSTPGTNTLSIITTDSNPISFAAGDDYRVRIATSDMSARAELPTDITSFIVYDADADFSEVNEGDAVRNDTWGGYGTITQTGVDAFGRSWFTYTRLKGGTYPDIFPGERYRIYYNYVDEREYTTNLKINGESNIYGVSGERKRDVCLGYGPNCLAASPTDEDMFGNGIDTQVQITDIGVSGSVVGSANVTLPTATTQGSFKMTGITFSLAEGFDALPGWLIKNDWHRLIYIAYSSGDEPGATTDCSPGTDCLVVDTTWNGNNNTQDDKRALLVSAGNETGAQDRTTGDINSYYELDNNNEDDIFTRDRDSTDFNDQIRVMATSP